MKDDAESRLLIERVRAENDRLWTERREFENRIADLEARFKNLPDADILRDAKDTIKALTGCSVDPKTCSSCLTIARNTIKKIERHESSEAYDDGWERRARDLNAVCRKVFRYAVTLPDRTAIKKIKAMSEKSRHLLLPATPTRGSDAHAD
jgi:hypothetical protein